MFSEIFSLVLAIWTLVQRAFALASGDADFLADLEAVEVRLVGFGIPIVIGGVGQDAGASPPNASTNDEPYLAPDGSLWPTQAAYKAATPSSISHNRQGVVVAKNGEAV